MAKINKFEDIRTWQTAREMANRVYRITGEGKFSKDFGLRDQIRRAAGSVMHNIAEGFDSSTDREFLRFLGYSRRSASEVQSQLYLGMDQHYIEQEEFDQIYELATKTKKQINSFIAYLAKQAYKVKEGKSEYTTEAIEVDDFDQSDDLDP